MTFEDLAADIINAIDEILDCSVMSNVAGTDIVLENIQFFFTAVDRKLGLFGP